MQKFPDDWDIVTKISYLQRKIIVSSLLYYEFNQSPISDKDYDELSKQLVELQKDPLANDSQYWYCFYDFDGNTGFDLKDRLNDHDKEYLTKFALQFRVVERKKKSGKS